MKKVLIGVPVSHTFFWPGICVSALQRFTTGVSDVEVEIVVVDNSWDWSAAARSVEDRVRVVQNPKVIKWHGSALDYLIETEEFDYLFAMESDVLILRDGWLSWYLEAAQPKDFAVGAWHHEQFINPSATLYAREALKKMFAWCWANESDEAHWGPNFEQVRKVDPNEMAARGPFAERRGWAPGTVITPSPSGQLKGPQHYEPGQQLFHWAVNAGHAYSVLPTLTERDEQRQIPIGTYYGPSRGEAYAVHLWAGTRALDLLKHPVEDPCVRDNMSFWLQREAQIWLQYVPQDLQERTLRLIKDYGWRLQDHGSLPKAQFGGHPARHFEEAVTLIESHYRAGGINFL